jgi:hypothetical protein
MSSSRQGSSKQTGSKNGRMTAFLSSITPGHQYQSLAAIDAQEATSPSSSHPAAISPSSYTARVRAGVVSSTGPQKGETKILSRANIRPILFCSLATFGAITYGYDGTYFTSLLAMNKFKQDYGTPISQGDGTLVTDITSSQRSLVTSIVVEHYWQVQLETQ